jgi:hypothetical protein
MWREDWIVKHKICHKTVKRIKNTYRGLKISGETKFVSAAVSSNKIVELKDILITYYCVY